MNVIPQYTKTIKNKKKCLTTYNNGTEINLFFDNSICKAKEFQETMLKIIENNT